MSALLTQSPGDTVQTGTGKFDQARKFKCTTAARVLKGKRFMFWGLVPNNFIERNSERMEIIWNTLNAE